MNRKTVTHIILSTFIMVLALSACQKTEKTTTVTPGAAGPPGASGSPGATGAPGFSGQSGATGATGNTGASGERGKTGGNTIVVVPPPSSDK